jgi:hypothetical protein
VGDNPGIFNFFITFLQRVIGEFGDRVMKYLFNGNTIFNLVAAGLALIQRTVMVLFVKVREDTILLK